MHEKAQQTWPAPAPYWVLCLAKECDATGLRAVAKKLQVSPASVSLAINHKNPAGYTFMQAKVESTFAMKFVPCPLLGVISKDECNEQSKREFTGANALRVKQYQMCKQCKYREEA